MRINCRFCLAVIIALSFTIQNAYAQQSMQHFWATNATAYSLIWDHTSSGSGIENGSGNWDDTSFNWRYNLLSANGSVNMQWPIRCADVVFGGRPGIENAGTITLTKPISNIKSISFRSTAGGNFTITNGGNIAYTITSCTGNIVVNVDAALSPIISTVITGSTEISKLGTGTLILSASNFYTGTTTINAGTLQIGNGGTGTLGTGDVINKAILTFYHSGSYSVSGGIRGTGSVIQRGGTTMFTGNTTYTGLTTIYGDTSVTLLLATGGIAINGNIQIGQPYGGGSGGTLLLGADNQISNNSTITLGHAYASQHSYFKLYGHSTSIGGLNNGADLGGEVLNGTSTNSVLTLAGTGTYTFGPVSGYWGTIIDGGAGKLSIVKDGSGTQIFTGGNSYSGGTIINRGTLKAGIVTAFGTGIITVNPGGTLNKGGFAIANTIVNNGGTIIP